MTLRQLLPPMKDQPPTSSRRLADDLVRGAEAIAVELGVTIAQVYRLSRRVQSGDSRKPAPPIFNDGITLCVRRSALDAYYRRLSDGSHPIGAPGSAKPRVSSREGTVDPAPGPRVAR